MTKPFDIVETYRSASASAPTRALRLSRAKTSPVEPPQEYNRDESLIRQLRRVTTRNLTAFDQGFQAAVDMVARGATLERLRAATGVVTTEWEDTHPIELQDDPTLVDAPAFTEES